LGGWRGGDRRGARQPAGPEPAPPRPLAPSRPAQAEPPSRSPLGPDDGRRFRRGRLIHRLLQSLPSLEPQRREAAGRAFLDSPLHDRFSSADQQGIEQLCAAFESRLEAAGGAFI